MGRSKLRALVIIAISAIGIVARADEPTRVVNSQTWSFYGYCDGRDLWNRWSVGGVPKPPDAFIRPWLDYPIRVIGFELVKLRQYPSWYARLYQKLFGGDDETAFFMVGSLIQPDAMIWLGPGETHASRVWTNDYGLPWPSSKEARPVEPVIDEATRMKAAEGDLIDLHGVCFGGGHVTIMLTLYYVPLKN